MLIDLALPPRVKSGRRPDENMASLFRHEVYFDMIS